MSFSPEQESRRINNMECIHERNVVISGINGVPEYLKLLILRVYYDCKIPLR